MFTVPRAAGPFLAALFLFSLSPARAQAPVKKAPAKGVRHGSAPAAAAPAAPDPAALGERGLAGLDAVEARRSLASRYDEQERFADAAREYRELVRLAPADARARRGLGDALAATGDAAGAQAEYEAAIKIDPKAARAYRALGQLLAAQ